jgi:hypothetical protein
VFGREKFEKEEKSVEQNKDERRQVGTLTATVTFYLELWTHFFRRTYSSQFHSLLVTLVLVCLYLERSI